MKDNILNVDYELKSFNVIELSNLLKSTYKNHYDIDDLISTYSKDATSSNVNGIDVPEIYEYQNFYLLDRGNHYILLDGFRRLILYSNQLPNININVHIYKESDLSNSQLLKLMLMLNHTKFFGGIGKYYQRGFALLFKTVFNIDLLSMVKMFEGYLTYNDVKAKSYSYSGGYDDYKMENVYNRLLLPDTLNDLMLLQTLNNTLKYFNTNLFGSMFYVKRMEYQNDFKFDVNHFVSFINDNTLVKESFDKYIKVGNDTGVRATEATNILYEQIKNYIDSYNGKAIEKSYAELLEIYQNNIKTLSKDKTLKKVTKSNFETITKDLMKSGKDIELVVLVKPNTETKTNLLDTEKIYDNEFKVDYILLQYHLSSLSFRLYFKYKDYYTDNFRCDFSIKDKMLGYKKSNDLAIFIRQTDNEPSFKFKTHKKKEYMMADNWHFKDIDLSKVNIEYGDK